MKNLTKNLIIAVIILVGIGIGILIWTLFGSNAPLGLVSIAAKTGNITEQINLIGQVKSSQGVDLAFESQGKIVANYVKAGDKIYAGQSLVAIDSSLLQAQLQQAQAQLDTLNINTVQSKTDVGLQSLYAGSLASAQKSVSVAKDVLLTISDIQFNHFTGQTPENTPLQNAKASAVNSLLGQANASTWTSESISQLNGGAYKAVQNAVASPTQANIDTALSATQTALQDVSSMVNAVPINSFLSASERAAITLAKTNINLEIITTSANIQAIASLKVNNTATISTTNAQIEAAQANVNAIKTQISKTVIRALFDGRVDKDTALAGQIISQNVPVITISNNNLEIQTGIPEIDLANAKIGGSANVTLDAFGISAVFPATIISLDSAPTIISGIPVYGAKLKFNMPDPKVKPGMTANISVISDTHKNVLLIPKSAVIKRNSQYFVEVNKGNSKREARQVTIGLSDNNNIEVTSGLGAGEKVLAY